ncbi:MAG: hypothetical protein ACTSU5_22360 [Promethearchaeota archaeon]
MSFFFAECTRCGKEFPRGELTTYRGGTYCKACLKGVREEGKRECPHCHRKFKDLNRHLKTCAANPENAAGVSTLGNLTAGRGAPPESRGLTADALAPVLEKAPVIQALSEKVERAEALVQEVREQVRSLKSEFELVGRQIPAALKYSLGNLAAAILEPSSRRGTGVGSGVEPGGGPGSGPGEVGGVGRDDAGRPHAGQTPGGVEFTMPGDAEIRVLVGPGNKKDWGGIYALADAHGWTLNYFTFLMFLHALDQRPVGKHDFYAEWVLHLGRGLEVVASRQKFRGYWRDFAGPFTPKRNKLGVIARQLLTILIERKNAPCTSRELADEVLKRLGRPLDYGHRRQIQNAVGRLARRGTLFKDRTTEPARYSLADCRP